MCAGRGGWGAGVTVVDLARAWIVGKTVPALQGTEVVVAHTWCENVPGLRVKQAVHLRRNPLYCDHSIAE